MLVKLSPVVLFIGGGLLFGLVFLGLTWVTWGLERFKEVPKALEDTPQTAMKPRVPQVKQAVFAILFACGAAHAYAGNELLRDFKGNSSGKYAADQYVRGVIDGVQLTEETTGQRYLCIQNSVRYGQIYDVVRQQLENVPASRHLNARSLVVSAVAQAWPCGPVGDK